MVQNHWLKSNNLFIKAEKVERMKIMNRPNICIYNIYICIGQENYEVAEKECSLYNEIVSPSVRETGEEG